MTKSFLKSLIDLTLTEAESKIKENKFKTWAVPLSVKAITSIARPNTVILWLKKEDDILKVRSAQAGDPTQVVD